jgi:hypothetical protein
VKWNNDIEEIDQTYITSVMTMLKFYLLCLYYKYLYYKCNDHSEILSIVSILQV